MYVITSPEADFQGSNASSAAGVSNLFSAVGHIHIPGICADRTILCKNLSRSDYIFFVCRSMLSLRISSHFLLNSYLKNLSLKINVLSHHGDCLDFTSLQLEDFFFENYFLKTEFRGQVFVLRHRILRRETDLACRPPV